MGWCRPVRRSVHRILAGAALVSAAAHGAPVETGLPAPAPPDLRLDVETGIGHESQQAPLFQVTPESAIVYLDGVQRHGGGHLRWRVQGAYESPPDQGLGFGVQADLQVKRAPRDRQLDLYSASVQPLWHASWGGDSIGGGLDLQTMGVAGRAFRDSASWVGHWTRPVPDGLWALIGEWGRDRHHGDFSDMDARVRTAVLQRRWNEPFHGVNGATLTVLAGRESNQRGLPELSHRSLMFSASLEGSSAGLDWTLRASRLTARFDAGVFAGEAVRRDRTSMLDAIVEWPVTDLDDVRLEWNLLDNRSSVRLYDTRYRQWSLSWSRHWR